MGFLLSELAVDVLATLIVEADELDDPWTLKYSARGLKMLPRQMVRTEKERLSNGETAGSGLASPEN